MESARVANPQATIGTILMCDSKDLLVSFVYDELDTREKQAFRTHMLSCAECRDEVADLRDARRHLASWAPPEPDLGFRIVRSSETPVALARPRFAPRWGLAAAAVLVLAAGAAVANVEVRYGAEGLVLRTGWNHQLPAGTASAGGSGAVARIDWKQQADALERRVQQLEAAASAPPAAAVAAHADTASAEVLRRVNALLDQSESRQERLMKARLAQLTQDIDARRKMDLAVIDQGLVRMQTANGAELRQSRDLMQRMYRATAYQPK
jgi:hypothetical protein